MIKNLKFKYNKAFGHNNFGKITSKHKGGGLNVLYRKINFNYAKYGHESTFAILRKKHYDPNRKSFIALITYLNGLKIGLNDYILDLKELKLFDIITFNSLTSFKVGNSGQINNMFLGAFISNIEFFPGQGSKLARAPETFAKILAIDSKYTSLKLPSGEIRLFLNTCFAYLGQINSKIKLKRKWKAGLTRVFNIRPTVRGVAMNANDHPHGGGEGRSGIGKKIIYTSWKKVKFKTRRKNKYSEKYILFHK